MASNYFHDNCHYSWSCDARTFLLCTSRSATLYVSCWQRLPISFILELTMHMVEDFVAKILQIRKVSHIFPSSLVVKAEVNKSWFKIFSIGTTVLERISCASKERRNEQQMRWVLLINSMQETMDNHNLFREKHEKTSKILVSFNFETKANQEQNKVDRFAFLGGTCRFRWSQGSWCLILKFLLLFVHYCIDLHLSYYLFVMSSFSGNAINVFFHRIHCSLFMPQSNLKTLTVIEP